MKQLTAALIYTAIFMALMTGCSKSPPPAQNAFVIEGGMLVAEMPVISAAGYTVADAAEQPMSGIVILRPGQLITDANKQATTISESAVELAAFDANRDRLIDAADPAWMGLHLSVDYDGDGIIGEGEYALIGECGIDALRIDAANNELQVLHKNGKTTVVTVSSSSSPAA